MKGIEHWRFGPIEVDPREHRLSNAGRVVPITRKAFALLVALLRRHGELVTKSELFEKVWPGVVVTDAALSRAIRELRMALGDSATAPRYIATVHGLGFRFVAQMSPEVGSGSATEQIGDCERWLVGREIDLGRLDAALAAARNGRRQIVFVVGEPGIGKSALVEKFVRDHGDEDDLWTAQGRCIEQYGPCDPHLPILEALEQLAHRSEAVFVEVFSRYAPTWLAQLPWLAREHDADALARAASGATPQRMLREIAHALEVLSLREPVLLWLEDLHWSDPSSLEVISFLAGRREAARLLMIGSFRPDDAKSGAAALQDVVLRLVQRRQAHELNLRRLLPEEINRYLGLRFASLDGASTEELAASIHRKTEGNALFVVSIVDDLVQRGELVDDGGRWHLRSDIAEVGERLPDSVRRLVHQQIERLSDEDRRLIEAAAVVGATFSGAAAAAALQSDPEKIEDRLVELALLGQLIEPQPAVSWPDGTLSASFRFQHALYWQGVVERVPHGRLADWQRRIGTRQEDGYGPQRSAVASELAMRFEAAHDSERAVEYLSLAGAAALSRCAYPECIDRLRHGLTLLPGIPLERRQRHELDLLLPLGAALMATQGYAASEVETVYLRALALCPIVGRPSDLVRALRGQWNVAFLRADLTAARSAAERLLTHAESLGDTRMRADALTKLGQTCLHQCDLEAACLHLQAALDSQATSGEPVELPGAPRVAAYLAYAFWYRGEFARAAQISEMALNLARRSESPHSRAFALGYVSWLQLMRGEVDSARILAVEQLKLSKEYGLGYWRQFAEFVVGAAMARKGRLADGIAVMQRAIDEMQASGGKVGVAYLLCLLAEAMLMAEQFDDANAAIEAANALMAATGNALYIAEARRIQALLSRAQDKGPAGRSTARRALQEGLEIARRQGARALELRVATSLAQLMADNGDARRAADMLSFVRSGVSSELQTEDLARADGLLQLLSRTT